jgi:hypothetical protein
MSINYIIIMVYGNINMIAKYMPNLKKVSEFEDKSIPKYPRDQALAVGRESFLPLVIWSFL